MKKIKWIGVCVIALISITGCSGRPSDDVMLGAITRENIYCPLPEGYCDATDYKITNEWSKMGDDNEMHYFYSATATFVSKVRSDGASYSALPKTWQQNVTVELGKRGNEWVQFH